MHQGVLIIESVKINKYDAYTTIGAKNLSLPKYVPSIINQANQTSQATRKKNVGSMNELFSKFLEESEDTSLSAWKDWYAKKHPNAIQDATEKDLAMLKKMQEAMNSITREMVEEWVEDLIINKTYYGFMTQNIVLKVIAEKLGFDEYIQATPEEESKGIDGHINGKAYQVKPMSYKNKQTLKEKINAHIIYYEKEKDGIRVEY